MGLRGIFCCNARSDHWHTLSGFKHRCTSSQTHKSAFFIMSLSPSLMLFQLNNLPHFGGNITWFSRHGNSYLITMKKVLYCCGLFIGVGAACRRREAAVTKCFPNGTKVDIYPPSLLFVSPIPLWSVIWAESVYWINWWCYNISWWYPSACGHIKNTFEDHSRSN